MGRRSTFARRPQDAYQTWDPRAVEPLLRVLPAGTRFVEPCVGEGKLAAQLVAAGHKLVFSSDLPIDASSHDYLAERVYMDCFITNPPWTRKVLHEIIANLIPQAPAWLLFDAAWMHTRQSAELMAYCDCIVSVGRVRWIEGSSMDGKDDCCWYRFHRFSGLTTSFNGRKA